MVKTKIRFKKLSKDKMIGYHPDRYKYYSVRSGNSLTELKQWIKWSLKHQEPPKEFLILDFSKTQFKRKIDDRYKVYATSELLVVGY